MLQTISIPSNVRLAKSDSAVLCQELQGIQESRSLHVSSFGLVGLPASPKQHLDVGPDQTEMVIYYAMVHLYKQTECVSNAASSLE